MTEVKEGQRWKERDARFSRTVVIVEVNHITGKAAIRSLDPMFGTAGGRLTWASLSRFNGKSGGYELIREAA